MAPRAAAAHISFTLDSASEGETVDELNAFPTPDSAAENREPTRKSRQKPTSMAKAAATRKAASKAKPTARRTSDEGVLGVRKGAAVAKKTAPSGGRRVLAERQNGNGSDTEEVDDFDDGVEAAVPARAPAKTSKRGRPPRSQKAEVENEMIDADAAPAKSGRKPSKKPVAARADHRTEHEAVAIPETQADPEHDMTGIEDSIEIDVREERIASQQPPARRVQPRARPAPQLPATHRRAGSASDTERDPALRRKVGDLTKRLDAMTLKYNSLKEVATSDRDSNFEQLESKTKQRAQDQDALIKALKQQVAEYQAQAPEMKKQAQEIAKLTADNKRLREQTEALTKELATARNESKTLSTKLVAARSSAPPESKNVPGSAVKARATGVVLPGTAEAAKEAQCQKLKMELYGDLTNLVILGVKKNEDDEMVYDCLQAGRNGTLHFHLTVTDAGETFEETEFVYNPLLDEQRDRDLIDLLPEYLTEEICFPRAQAPKFYTKIVDSMSKKIILEDD